MKKILIGLALVVSGLTAVSFAVAKTSIVGKVGPPNSVEMVWVIGTTDSVKSSPVDGQFSFDVNPGTFRIIIDAKEPFKDVLLDNIQVQQDQILDLGEITLKQ